MIVKRELLGVLCVVRVLNSARKCMAASDRRALFVFQVAMRVTLLTSAESSGWHATVTHTGADGTNMERATYTEPVQVRWGLKLVMM
jgi:hypothetical protein